MYDSADAITQMGALGIDVGFMLVYILGAVCAGAVALVGLGFGWRHLSVYIYNHGGNFRHFGKPPYKGYNRWRSYKWNLNHTA